MTVSERAMDQASAVQDFINCLFYLRSLRAAPPIVSTAELEEWGEIFDRAQSTFAELQEEIQAGRAETSLPLTSVLLGSTTKIRAHLSVISPGAQLPATVFDLVDVAWSELMPALGQ